VRAERKVIYFLSEFLLLEGTLNQFSFYSYGRHHFTVAAAIFIPPDFLSQERPGKKIVISGIARENSWT
jgi:hypothetical protein